MPIPTFVNASSQFRQIYLGSLNLFECQVYRSKTLKSGSAKKFSYLLGWAYNTVVYKKMTFK